MTSTPTRPSAELQKLLGAIDIYVFDQLLRGRFDGRKRILDAGCGSGRNILYLLRSGYEVFAIDRSSSAVENVRAMAADVAPELPAENIQIGELDALPWADLEVDAVICSAVLHFATDPSHFGRMVEEMWRVLRPGGLFVARLASVIGLEADVALDRNRRATLPDGTERFLVDEPFINEWIERLGAIQLDPIKTTNVQNLRCMTTLVLQKRT